MPPRIDIHGLRITDGRRAWSFEVDCRVDCARIELNGVSYSVRPLRWRDKQVLARLSALGEEFLKREFVRLSFAEPTPLPEDKDDQSLLFELAKWYNAPDGQEMLPLDQATLSQVTMKLCHSLGIAPKYFDQRNANEIETFWRVAASSQAFREESTDPMPAQRSEAPQSPNTTRILILPDSNVPASPANVPVARASAEMNSEGFEDGFSAPKISDQTTFNEQQLWTPNSTSKSPSADQDNDGDNPASAGDTRLRSPGDLSAAEAGFPQSDNRRLSDPAPPSLLSERSEIAVAPKQSRGPLPPDAATASQWKKASAPKSSNSSWPGSDSLDPKPLASDPLPKESLTERSAGLKSFDVRSHNANRFRSESIPVNSVEGIESTNAAPGLESIGQGSFDAQKLSETRFRSQTVPSSSIESIFGSVQSPDSERRGLERLTRQRNSSDLLPGTTPELTDLRTRDSRALLATLPPWSNTVEQHGRPTRPESYGSAEDFSDVENIFDELTERVAQSAMQLGIDVEY